MTILRKLLVRLPIRIGHLLLMAIAGLVGLFIPRSRRIWAFGSWSGQRFADNPKYFFLHCASLDPAPIRPVWLSRDRAIIDRIRRLGFSAYHRSSPRGVWYAMRAGVYVFDCHVMDVAVIGTAGAVKVNLWHGVPLKQIGRDITISDHPNARVHRGKWLTRVVTRVRAPQLVERYDYVLATSSTTAARFASALGVQPDQIIRAGYPRTDPLLFLDGKRQHCLPEEERIVEEFRCHARERRRVLLYMPTFRDWNNNAGRTIPIDWAALNAKLDSCGGMLYCKLHPNDQASLPNLDGLSRVRIVSSAVDPYAILAQTDALITDYSSIFFDYLVLDRPIVFYPYDLDEYQRLSRALYDPYDRVTPGPKAYRPKELEDVIVRLLAEYEELSNRWRTERERVRTLAHEHVDSKASERLLADLLERLELA